MDKREMEEYRRQVEAAESWLPTDDEVADAIKSVPTHYTDADEPVIEREAIGAQPIFPQNLNGAAYTGYLDLSRGYRACFRFLLGTWSVGATCAISVVGSNSALGASNAAILSAAYNATAGNSAGAIEIRADQTNYRYVAGVITSAAGAIQMACLPTLNDLRYKPGQGLDFAPGATNSNLVIFPDGR